MTMSSARHWMMMVSIVMTFTSMTRGLLVEISVGVFVEKLDNVTLSILNNSMLSDTTATEKMNITYSYVTKQVKKYDAYSITKSVCTPMEVSPSILLSFLPCDANPALAQISQSAHLPLLSWAVCNSNRDYDWLLPASPYNLSFRSVVKHVVENQKWLRLVFLYDNSSDDRVKQGLLDELSHINITLVQFEQETEHITQRHFWIREENFILYTREDTVFRVLREARVSRLDIIGPRYKWLVLDTGIINMDHLTTHLQEGDNLAVIKPYTTSTSDHIEPTIRTMTEVLEQMHSEGYELPSDTMCFTNTSQEFAEVFNSRFQETVAGRAGSTEYSLWTYTHGSEGRMSMIHAGNWTSQWKLNMWRPLYPQLTQGFNNRTFVVAAVEYEPFTMRDENGTWIGLLFELLNELAFSMNFSYIVKHSEDNSFGVDIGNNTYNGIIGVIQRKEADFAVAPVTILHGRASVVDFTLPFWEDPYIVLIRRPDPGEYMTFICLGPFSATVWVVISLSVLVVSAVLWISLHYYPGTEMDPKPSGFSQLNLTTWQTFGALMQQGMVQQPVITSGRVIVAMWWFYVIVIAGTYNGNLIAFLTAPKTELPINSLQDLANSEMAFGALRDAAFQATLQKSEDGIYHQLWDKVKNNVDNFFPRDTNEGLERVLEDKKYAFIVEASLYTMIHVTNSSLQTKQCEFARPNDNFFMNMYGFPFQKGSPYTKEFSMQLLRTLEAGLLKRIRRKWLASGNRCTGLERMAKQNNIGLLEAQGAFYILGIGIVAAMVVLVMECFTAQSRCKGHSSIMFQDCWCPERPSVYQLRPPSPQHASSVSHSIGGSAHNLYDTASSSQNHNSTQDFTIVEDDMLNYVDIFSGEISKTNHAHESNETHGNRDRRSLSKSNNQKRESVVRRTHNRISKDRSSVKQNGVQSNAQRHKSLRNRSSNNSSSFKSVAQSFIIHPGHTDPMFEDAELGNKLHASQSTTL